MILSHSPQQFGEISVKIIFQSRISWDRDNFTIISMCGAEFYLNEVCCHTSYWFKKKEKLSLKNKTHKYGSLTLFS